MITTLTRLPRAQRLARRTAVLGGAIAAAGAVSATAAATASAHRLPLRPRTPVTATVLSPLPHSVAGVGGDNFVVDVALDADGPRGNRLLSTAAGYHPFFNDPSATTFHPGPDLGAPGLVVLLSTTPTMPGTPFQGPRTNLAGLFQINGDALVAGRAESWDTWQVGKPLFGTGPVRLTVYAVKGTAPAVVPAVGPQRISNTVQRRFSIGG